ncbi:MAG: ATP-binding protein [Desulfuromonadaceae bacterium]|nr:ATP-binding protein [Desulfuromonadaceae bacterium]MDD5104981.1 ATP-binding protein [Desulfuromonadaceae bacterium]
MGRAAVRAKIDELALERLLGLDNSKIGFYAEVKQKIHELEAANLGLRSKSSELQAMFDSISDGVIVYDNNGMVQHRNHVCPQYFPQKTLPGCSCRELFHPEYESAPHDCPVERALAGERVEISMTSQNSDMKDSYFDVTATPIEDNKSEQKRALVFLRDVTEKRLQELQLMQAEKLSSIGVLAAGVAHEINNPLSSVAGYAEALLRRFSEENSLTEDRRFDDFPKYLQVIVRESYRCKGIIDSLLSFSRKSDGSLSNVDINDVLSEVLELVRYKSRYEKIEIRTNFQSDIPDVIGDPSGLRQVCLNLLLNAHQAIHGAGIVEISTRMIDTSTVQFEVRDTGCGIPKETIDQIWNPFFTTKDVGKGLGLGLAVTYNIIKRLGGDISVESQVGIGSKFSVRMPACQK